MPNHCTNKVSIIGSRADEFASAVNVATPHYPPQGDWDNDRGPPEVEPFSFHAIVPIPPHVLASQWDPTGYNWQRENWGTKWGAYDYGPVKHSKHSVTYTFDTAWSPPLPVLRQASHRWGVVVALSYHEEMPSRGRYLFAAGQEYLGIHDRDYPSIRSHARWHKEYFRTHEAWVRELTKSRHVKKANEIFALRVAQQNGDMQAGIRAWLGSL